jgi:hypothetical protein
MIPPRPLHVDWRETEPRLAQLFPALHLDAGGGRPLARGTLTIDDAGREVDRFLVEIDFGPLAAGELPKVWETEGRIPRTAKRHVNAEDGSACVCLPEDYFLRHPGRFDVVTFLEGPVRDFFVGQAIVERGGAWPHGEWGHGGAGKEEWAKGFIDSLPAGQFGAYVNVMAMKELKGHIGCPCGSGRRARDCHLELLRLLRAQVSRATAMDMIERARRKLQGGAP